MRPVAWVRHQTELCWWDTVNRVRRLRMWLRSQRWEIAAVEPRTRVLDVVTANQVRGLNTSYRTLETVTGVDPTLLQDALCDLLVAGTIREWWAPVSESVEFRVFGLTSMPARRGLLRSHSS